MAETLTPQQEMAVHNRGGKLLVSAAAGSGKTKVLVDRLLTYLCDPENPADLDSFLIITYTKAAATELRGKIAAKVSQLIAKDPENRHLQKQLQKLYLTKISTVHGFCADVLREYAYRLDLGADFRVADEGESRELQMQVLTDLLEHSYDEMAGNADYAAFVDTQGLGRDDRQVPELVLQVYNSARCHQDPERWLSECASLWDGDADTDLSDTPWGKVLMQNLFSYLDNQIAVFRLCVREAEVHRELAKPVDNLQATLNQLEALRSCQKWDDICSFGTVDFGRLVFPKNNPDLALADRIKAIRENCKKQLTKQLLPFGCDSAQAISDLSQTTAAARGLVSLVRQFDAEYSALKHSRRVLDFSDLEHKMLDLLLGKQRSGVTSAAREIGARFREILVDEYQDSNGVQDAIFNALSDGRNNCFLVGDVKQSIYRFRLADPGIFLEKKDSFAPAEQAGDGEGRAVMLSHNFRSGPEVIEAVNHVFSVCMNRDVGEVEYNEEEMLREGVAHAPLPDTAVELYALETQEQTTEEEAAFVARRIRKMLSDGTQIRDGEGFRPVTPGDIAILLRAPGSVGSAYQRALEAQGIRCNNGGGEDLLRAQEIEALRALLQTIANPRQDIPLLAVLASPVFGFTADELAQIRSRRKKGVFYDALLESDLPKVESFLSCLQILRQESRLVSMPALLERCFALTRLDSVYAAMPGGDVRMQNLQLFCQLVSSFDSTGMHSLEQLLEHLSAAEERGLLASAGAVGEGVTLMSIHKSKGLEFPVVFLCGLARKFNQDSLRRSILCDRELGLGMYVADTHNRIRYPSIARRAIAAKITGESLSEELRVLYVAMTRARDRLVMTYAAIRLDAILAEMSTRLGVEGVQVLNREATCPGTWVLLAAMGRTEAGALRIGDDGLIRTHLGTFPWIVKRERMDAVDAAEQSAASGGDALPLELEQEIRESLAFQYAHTAAVSAPSKQTATGRKGRQKDAEAAENAPSAAASMTWRAPTFLSGKRDALAYGTAMHAAMQFISYEACGSEAEVRREIDRLVQQGFLKPEQGEMVNCAHIAAFFATELGKMLLGGAECLREFKFSILDSGTHYGEGLEGEQVLLQGVVDCAVVAEHGILVLDFKTDYITEETAQSAAERYRIQLQTYADSLERIYERLVLHKYLYFFRLGKLFEM